MDSKHLKGKYYLFSSATNPLTNTCQEFNEYFLTEQFS